MTITYGFYNSVSGDRTYNAIELSSIFDGIITDGVFELVGDGLIVSDGSTGLEVVVGEGRAWFNHTWTLNDADLTLTLDDSDLVLDRIDAVILEVDSSTSIRANSIKVVTGTPASTPVEPTLTETSEIHQYPLAYIYVAAGVEEIVLTDITNLIGSYLCPFVTVPQAGSSGGAAVLEVQVFS